VKLNVQQLLLLAATVFLVLLVFVIVSGFVLQLFSSELENYSIWFVKFFGKFEEKTEFNETFGVF
jgi:hypothetical protein